MSRFRFNHSNFRTVDAILKTTQSNTPPPDVLKNNSGQRYWMYTLSVITILLGLFLITGCPFSNTIETKNLRYDANTPQGHTLIGPQQVDRLFVTNTTVTIASPDNLTTMEGGTAIGWNTMPDGSGQSYSSGEEITLATDTTLYATWKLPQLILNSAEAVQVINALQPNTSVDILITGSADFNALKNALTSTSGTVELNLTEADNISAITSGAFQGAAGLASVTLPNTVTSIGSNAFANSGLKTLVLEGNANSISIEQSALPDNVTIYVPHDQLDSYISKFSTLQDKFVSSQITIIINWTGAGTSELPTTYTGEIGTVTNIPQKPVTPSHLSFVKWVDDEGKNLTLPLLFKGGQATTIEANALFTNTAGYPVYPAYLTVNRTSYAAAENDDVGQEKPDWADKIYSQQLVKRPISNPTYSDVFKFGDGSSQIPVRGSFTVTTGDEGGEQTGSQANDGKGGSFRIPALTSIQLPSGLTRIFAAMDMRYRGREDGNGDCGTNFGSSDFLVMYSDDGGASWTKKVIDVNNTWSETGQANSMTRKTDIGDPSLWTVGTKVYVGGVGGSAISGGRNSGEESTTRVFVSADYGETWTEDTDISQNRYTYAYNWNSIDGKLTNPGGTAGYANLPCPGHGIVLTKDVPGTDMKAGMTAVPMQGGKGDFQCYMAYGNGDPSTWSNRGTAAIVQSNNNGEWQMCQLDDGTILGTGKPGGSTFARYKDNVWTTISADAWKGRGLSQVSILKVMNGDDTGKYGIVAFSSPKGGGANPTTDFADSGRNQITISFARDISKEKLSMSDSPLDSERYYVQIRKMGQRYFGYTDMVMVDDETIGVLYECFDKTNNNLDGMRFILIDASEVIKKLSVKPVQE